MQRTLFDSRPRFDGGTYDSAMDESRLTCQLEKVKHLMMDGYWRTLAEIQAVCGGSEAGISARVRDLRKQRCGGHKVERRRVVGGVWQYRVITG